MRAVVALAFGVFAAAAAQAQDIDCTTPKDQAEIGHCIKIATEEAAAELDVAYGLAWSRMVRIDETLPAGRRGAEVALRNAQQNWIRYRDTTCASEGFEHAGEEIEPMVVSLCSERLTRARIEDLRAIAQPD